MKSLFIRSEALFWKHHSIVEPIDGGWIVRTPQNPTWHWGNLLVLDSAPQLEELEHWLALFRERIPRLLTGTLMTWDQGEMNADAISRLDEYSLSLSFGDVLTLATLGKPEHYNPNVELSEVGNDDDLWQKLVEINIEGFAAGFDAAAFDRYARYAKSRIRDHRTLVARGLGNWYVAKLGGEVAGGLGIFEGEGFYRFQEIVVREEFRRQGVASTMTYEVARRAQEHWPGVPQVIVAESDGNANRVYRSLGFEVHSRSEALQAKTNLPAPEGL